MNNIAPRGNGPRQNAGERRGAQEHKAAVGGAEHSNNRTRNINAVVQSKDRSIEQSAPRTRNESFREWFRRTFAVDSALIEKRDIVREKGSIDYVFLITVIILLSFGTVMVYSASYA